MPGRSPNRILRELMHSRRFTREQLANEVCTAAYRLTGHSLNCTARQVGRWLSGEVIWPWPRYRAPLEVVFGFPAEDLGFMPPAGYTGVKVRNSTPASDQEEPVLRRQFILGLGTILALPVLPTTGRLGLGDIDAIQAAAARLHDLDDEHGGAELADVSARYVGHAEQSARACVYGPAVQKRLHASIGDLAASAGWFSYDGGQQDGARRWWDLALRYAVLGGDSVLQARIWSYMARQACDLGHGGEAVAIARVALDSTRNRREARLSALLHARVALGHSLTGERGRAGQSLHRAEQMLDRAPTETTRWLEFCGPGEITGQAALVDYNLGQYQTAADRDQAAMGLLPPGFGRNSFATQVSLARNQLAAGRADEALVAGHRALDLMGSVKSPRWARHLETLKCDLLRTDPSGASGFAERYREMATV